ncbi:MAG: hypothetical protein ABSA09_08505 [Desulfobaccales bacterium]|jgi:hypothetical protein
MKDKVLPPYIIWLGVWLAMFSAILVFGSWQDNLNRQEALAKSGQRELVGICSIFPYAIAYLEEQQRPDLLKEILSADLGPYAVVLTDKAGNLKYAPDSWPPGNQGVALLKGKKYYYLFKDPATRPCLSGLHNGAQTPQVPGVESAALGRLYLVEKESQGLGRLLPPPYDTVSTFSLLSYFMVLVGFAGICAIAARYQRQSQELRESRYASELEARELRIQNLETNIRAADLRLELLDRSQEQAQAWLRDANDTIAALQQAVQHQSRKSKKMQESLKGAESARNEALAKMQVIELDREGILKEMKELEALKEVEELSLPDPAKKKARRPQEFLWLNMVYRNLHFSRRALQDILDLQNSTDIFPSLPDALATLNNTGIEAMKAGAAIPSRSAVQYSQLLAHHYGDLWEYRFSKDGRIFFGLSKSRTWNIDTVLLKRHFTENRYKYESYLEQTLGKDNDDLQMETPL